MKKKYSRQIRLQSERKCNVFDMLRGDISVNYKIVYKYHTENQLLHLHHPFRRYLYMNTICRMSVQIESLRTDALALHSWCLCMGLL